jgi:hypothetical protein
MKRILRILALALALGASILWFALGANRGWTRTSVPVKIVDDVTGIEGVQYRKQFVPGLDILGGALVGAGLLAAASAFFRSSNQKTN